MKFTCENVAKLREPVGEKLKAGVRGQKLKFGRAGAHA